MSTDQNITTVVLNGADFASVEALFAARVRIAGPVLYVVPPAWLTAVIDRLDEQDDVCSDNSPAELIEHRLQRLSYRGADRRRRDRLTGLLLARGLVEAVDAAPPTAVLVINLDHFKKVNDEYGHQVGDEILREAAERLVAASPSDALLARLGGDSFVVALRCERGQARMLGAALGAAIRGGPFARDIGLSASIGVAAAPSAAPIGYSELLARADRAVYAAKVQGRDCVVDYADREREAESRHAHIEVESFEDMTRVLAERVAEVIARRGRRVFEGLRAEADLDVLTGLYARRYLDRRLPFELAEAQRGERPLTLALLDVDHFGLVNREHGWPSGDRVLTEVAARVRGALRSTDWAARYGGEEFCVVLDGATLEEARAVLERVREAVAAQPFEMSSKARRSVTISVGIAQHCVGDVSTALVERASDQLLAAKRSGRNRVCG